MSQPLTDKPLGRVLLDQPVVLYRTQAAAHDAAARALIRFMQGPAMAAAFSANGVQQIPAADR